MSGRQLAAKLKLVLPGLKVLFISGYGGPGEGAEEAGFLEKPFTPASLIDAVGRVFWTGRRRSAGRPAVKKPVERHRARQ